MDATGRDQVGDSAGHVSQGEGARGVKLSDVVYFKIAQRIRSGEYCIGSRLPTENELADMLGVSRPIVREALARLRTDGVVVSRRGSGTYVQRADDPEPRHVPPLTSLADMRRSLEFRISFEGESAWHAALGADEHKGPLHQAIVQLSDDLAKRVLPTEHDFEFHYSIALATGNRFFHETMTAMRPTILTALQITPTFISPRSQERLATLHAEHDAIYAAIVVGDADGARNAMRTHLSSSMKRIFEGL